MSTIARFVLSAIVASVLVVGIGGTAFADAPGGLSLGDYASELEHPLVAQSEDPIMGGRSSGGTMSGQEMMWQDEYLRAQRWGRIGGWSILGGVGLTFAGVFLAADCFSFYDGYDDTGSCGGGLVLLGTGVLVSAFGQITLAAASTKAGRRLQRLGVEHRVTAGWTSVGLLIGSVVLSFVPSTVGVGSVLGLGAIIAGAVQMGKNNRTYRAWQYGMADARGPSFALIPQISREYRGFALGVSF